jgi:hypothetical protein
VLETTSTSTRRKDKEKKETYQMLGVAEYFQFDPYGEYLDPRLQGVRLHGGRYQAVQPEPDGSLLSQATGVLFRAEGDRLRLTDAATGALLLRNEEKTRALREAEAKATAEAMARHQAEERVRALEDELARLRRPAPPG